MTLVVACLALMVAAVLLLGLARDLLYSALALALASVMLSIVLFQFGANVAAVFELSVCAGLITVLFVSTVSLTKDSDQKSESRLPAIFLLPVAIVLIGVAAFGARWLAGQLPPVTAVVSALTPSAPATFHEFHHTFWNERATDVLGQIALILTGVFGMLAVLRSKAAGRHHD
jgi:NADH-quinone oxidoreductase subunit J